MERIAEQQVVTEFGEFTLLAYEDHVHRDVHLALVRGQLDASQAPLVRVHPIDTLSDLIGVRDAGRTWTLRDAMQAHRRGGHGRRHRAARSHHAARARGRGERARHSARGMPRRRMRRRRCCAPTASARRSSRTSGVTRMQVLSAPKQLQGIAAFGLEITGYVAD